MTSKYDAIILGAGHNGLILQAYLSRAGLSTVCLERRDVIGINTTGALLILTLGNYRQGTTQTPILLGFWRFLEPIGYSLG